MLAVWPRPYQIWQKRILRKMKAKSNSNILSNQLGIHLILAKREKLSSNSLAKPTWQK
jgi:hypothetical protein